MTLRSLAALAGVCVLVVSTRTAAQQSITPSPRDPPWAMKHANAARTGQSPALGAVTGQVAWKLLVAGVPRSFAVDASGRIHAGVLFNGEFWSNESYAYVISPEGEIAWRAKVTPYDWGASQGVRSSPALDAAGRISVPSGNGEVIQFWPDGQVRWVFSGSSNTSNDSSPLVRPDGATVHNQVNYGLTCIASDGTVLWHRYESLSSSSSPALSPNGDMAIGGNAGSYYYDLPALHYLNPNGTVRWEIEVPGGAENDPIFGPDGTLYYCLGGLNAYRSDGTIQWIAGFGGETPALSSGGVLYVSVGAEIRSVFPDTGAQRSVLTAPGNLCDGLAIGDGTLYATTTNGYVCAWAADGALLFATKVCDAFSTGPVVGGSRDVIAGGEVGFGSYVFSIR